MISITLNRTGDDPVYHPGEEIAGKVAWSDMAGTDRFEIRLIWYTTGRGDRDAQYVAAKTVGTSSNEGQSDFSFTAPHRPNSFSGKLIAIQWGIEVIAFPQREAAQALLAIEPTSGPIVLEKVDPDDAFWNSVPEFFRKFGRKAKQV